MTGRISLQGVQVFARHGVFDHEREIGQRFVIDLDIDLDLDVAAQQDDLRSTIDYGALARRVHDLVATEQWNLIERIAWRVADEVLSDPRVEAVAVTVHKPDAPLPVDVDDVAVTLRRER